MRNNKIRRFLGEGHENWKKKTVEQLGTKGEDESADKRGIKDAHTDLALRQCRKQWSIISTLGHEAQREDEM